MAIAKKTASRRDTFEAVTIVSTGGTFDKAYDPVSETMRLRDASCIPTILDTCGAAHLSVVSPFSVDSLDMTDEMRVELLDVVRDMARAVVVHGSGSMVETARLFMDAGMPGVVVFTGAMIPFSCNPVEASFNLGGAVALAGCLDPGVYIFMHGRLFDPRHTRKDQAIARLVEVP